MKFGRAGWSMLALLGCATPGPAPDMAERTEPTLPSPPQAPPPPAPRPVPITPDADPTLVRDGELPWWYALKPGPYMYGERVMVMATGRSVDHHHVIEGFVQAKVTARLGVRRAAASVAFSGNLPEPELVDLFITRDRKFLALYGLPLGPPPSAAPPDLRPPEVVSGSGRHRIGRHLYQESEHLFLECEVEGPIANPDWGRTRAAAFLYRPDESSHR